MQKLIAFTVAATLCFSSAAEAAPVLDTSSLLFYPSSDAKMARDFVPEDLVQLSEFGIPTDGGKIGREEGSMRKIVVEDLKKLTEECPNLVVRSGFRSYQKQVAIYGKTAAGYAAEPGTSEHQTGLALDFISKEFRSFRQLPPQPVNDDDLTCLKEHANDHGFIQSFPKGHPVIEEEIWHYRYVGTESISAMRSMGKIDRPWEFFADPISKKTLARKAFLDRFGNDEFMALRKGYFTLSGKDRLAFIKNLPDEKNPLEAAMFLETLE